MPPSFHIYRPMCGDFNHHDCCAVCSGYGCYVNETEHKETLENVFGVEEQDICWVTPVLDKHFTYHGEVLAGGLGAEGWFGAGCLSGRCLE